MNESKYYQMTQIFQKQCYKAFGLITPISNTLVLQLFPVSAHACSWFLGSLHVSWFTVSSFLLTGNLSVGFQCANVFTDFNWEGLEWVPRTYLFNKVSSFREDLYLLSSGTWRSLTLSDLFHSTQGVWIQSLYPSEFQPCFGFSGKISFPFNLEQRLETGSFPCS